MAMMTHAKSHFNWLMLTLIFGIWASEPPRAWRTTEKAGPDRVNDLKESPSFLEYLKLNVNCSCVRKENTKQKEIIHLVDPRTLQNKAAETIF